MRRASSLLPTAGLGALLLLPGTGVAAQQAPARSPDLWGRVQLVEGDVVEGFLRWDRNETTTADLLDGERAPTVEGMRLRRIFSERSTADRRRSVELPGLRVTWEEEELEVRVQSGVRFGRIDRIVPDGSGAVVMLRDGGSVELHSSSSDLGPGFRGLEVESPEGEVRELAWRDIADVRLLPVPPGRTAARVRLHGTVETTRGARFTGWIAWDADEAFDTDVLDGEGESLRFARISAIERAGRGVRVTLSNGERRTLSGTSDASGGNRGIHVSDPDLGNVVVAWEAFAALRLHAATSGTVPLDGGGPLVGTLETASGAELSGRVVWDLDETEGWHLLDGEADGVRFDIEFSRIARIEKARGGDGVRVTLRDGRTLDLEGSNDVGPSNRGIVVVTDDGTDRLVDWAGFRSLTLGGGR